MMDMDRVEDGQVVSVAPRAVEFKGETLKVPDAFWDVDGDCPNVGALVKSHSDLRRKLSEHAGDATLARVPETYELVVPEHLSQMIEINHEDPLAKGAMDWARKHGLDQDAFSELTALYYDKIVPQSDEDHRQGEMEKLHNALGPRADADMKELSSWVDGLLGDDLANAPELYLALDHLTSTADGVLLMKKLKDRLTERGVPTSRYSASRPLDAEALRQLQSSDAYASGDPIIRRKVTEGWSRLYPRTADEI